MRLIRVKTDKVDAMLIAQYGKLKKIGLMATYTGLARQGKPRNEPDLTMARHRVCSRTTAQTTHSLT